MADTRMYGNLINEEISDSSTGSFRLKKSPMIPIGPNYPKRPKRPLWTRRLSILSMENGFVKPNLVNPFSTGSRPIHQLMKSDTVTKFGRVKSSRLSQRTANEHLLGRPGSAASPGVSVTRELAFGIRNTGENREIQGMMHENIMGYIPDAPCLGRILLLIFIFVLVILVYFLNLKQFELERRIRERWDVNTSAIGYVK